MNCPKCGTPMVINEWDGWIWMCFHCDYIGRVATNEEVELQEKEYERIKHRAGLKGYASDSNRIS